MASFKIFNTLVIVATVLLLASLVFQILPTISAPVTSTLFLSKVDDFIFGVFGYCDTSSGDCSDASIGYDIPMGVDYEDFRFQGYNTRIMLSKILILHPVASFLNLVVCCMTASLFLFEDLLRLESMISVTMMVDAICIICNVIVFIVDIVLFIPHVNYLAWLVIIGFCGTFVSMGLLWLAKRDIQKILYYNDGGSTMEDLDKKRLSSLNDLNTSQSLYATNLNKTRENKDIKARVNSVSMYDEEELAAEKEADEKDMVHKRVAELANSEFDGTVDQQYDNTIGSQRGVDLEYYYDGKTKKTSQGFQSPQQLQPGLYYDRYDGEGIRKSSLDPTAPNKSPVDAMDSRVSNIVPIDMSIYQSNTTPNFERMSHFDHASYLDRISYYDKHQRDPRKSQVMIFNGSDNTRNKKNRKKKRKNAHDRKQGVWGGNSPRKSINSRLDGNISKYGTSDSSLDASMNNNENVNHAVPVGESSTGSSSTESSIIANHQQGVDSISSGKMASVVTGSNNNDNNGHIILVSGGNRRTNYGDSSSQLSLVKEEAANKHRNCKNKSESEVDLGITPIATLSDISTSTTDDSDYNKRTNEEYIFGPASQVKPNSAKLRLDNKIQETKLKQRKKMYLVNGYESSS